MNIINQVFSLFSKPLKITMFGPSGVGKTSLLASIYDHFDRLPNIQIKPKDEKSKTILEERLRELKSLVNSNDTIRPKQRIQGTVEPRDFSFELDIGSSQLKLNFKDFPGEYVELKAKQEQLKSVTKYVNESTAILIAIDTPALIEKNSQFHEDINKPKRILELFKEAFKNVKSQKLIIFVPVKCERYVQNEKDTKKLVQSLKDEYEDLLNFFRQGNLEYNVAVVVTPVQTVGSLFFSRMQLDNDGIPNFYFRKKQANALYEPRDCEQPLRYLIRFLLKSSMPIIGAGGHKKALLDVANGCKNTGGFEVIQGSNLLSINRK